MKQKGIVWFRQDLRSTDNEAIMQAVSACDEVIYVYVFEASRWEGNTRFGFPKIGVHRRRFLMESVQALKEDIESKGGHLHVLYGPAEQVIFDLAKRVKSSWIFCNRERTHEEVQIQDALEHDLWSIGQEMRFSRGKMLLHTADLPFPVTQTPDQFTAFRKEVEKITPIRDPLSAPKDLKSSAKIVEDQWPDEVGKEGLQIEFKGGAAAGWDRLSQYFWKSKAVLEYKKTRNGLLGDQFSSRFSPWLAQGCVSPKEVYKELKNFEEEHGSNPSTYWLFFELLWRDFFRLMGKKHGKEIFLEAGYAQRPRMAGNVDHELFEKWRKGETGTPIIDACMRQLEATGWLSNRGRQIVASFLINDLKVHWLMGAAFFESMLIDYDPCSNYGNWAYIAGVGSDTRNDRHFNIISQARKYDGDGAYVRHWVPELKHIGGFDIHLADARLKRSGETTNGLSIYVNPLVGSDRWT